jgi:flagellar biosynthesis protein FlhA
MLSAGHPPVVLCSPQIRLGFKRFFESNFSDLAVLSYAELPPRLEIQTAGIIPSHE